MPPRLRYYFPASRPSSSSFLDPSGRPGPFLRFSGGPVGGLVVRRFLTWVHCCSPSVAAGAGAGAWVDVEVEVGAGARAGAFATCPGAAQYPQRGRF
jgi:hypothetical protein